MLLSALGSAALAAPLVLLPPGMPADEATKVQVEGLVEAQLGEPATLLPASVLLDEVALLTLRARDQDCDELVSSSDWRRRLEGAEGEILRLQLPGALSRLVALEAEAPCLDAAVEPAALQRLELGLAHVHLLLGRASGGAARELHERELAGALDRAAAMGPDLGLPVGLPAELGPLLDAARQPGTLRLVVAGPAAPATRVDGRAPPSLLVPGGHLFQVAPLGAVLAAETWDVHGPAVVWAQPGHPGWTGDEVRDRWADLGRGEDPERDQLLAALVRASGRDLLLWGDGQLYGVSGDTLAPTGAPSDRASAGRSPPARPVATGGAAREPAADRAPPSPAAAPRVRAPRTAPPATPGPHPAALVGAALGGGASNVRGGALDGLGGGVVGGSMWAGLRAGGPYGVLVTSLYAAPSRVPIQQGGGVLFRGSLPLRVGLWWTGETAHTRFFGGPELGVHLFGAFPSGFPVSPLLGASGGLGGRGWTTRLFALGGITAPASGGGPYGMVGLEAGVHLHLGER